MLSVAFGIALDIQNGKGGQIYKAVGDIFNLGEEVDLMWVLFATGENPNIIYYACKQMIQVTPLSLLVSNNQETFLSCD